MEIETLRSKFNELKNLKMSMVQSSRRTKLEVIHLLTCELIEETLYLITEMHFRYNRKVGKVSVLDGLAYDLDFQTLTS